MTREKFLERIDTIRAAAPDAALRSSFILGYPGETEDDHDLLLSFLAEARLDWAGFFTFSEEPGTYAEGLAGAVPAELALERLRECSELQDALTAERRAALVGERLEVLVDEPGVARSHREAPDIDGVVHVEPSLAVGEFHKVVVTGAAGPDLWARVVTRAAAASACTVSTFGPSALNTPANAITVARLLATPVLVVMIAVHGAGVGPVRRGAGHRAHRRGRRMAGAPSGHHAFGRVPRPLGGQGRRGGRLVRPGGQGRAVVDAGGHHRGARGAG